MRNPLTGLPNLKSVEKKISGGKTKLDYRLLGQSYEPDGDMTEMADFSLDDLEKPKKKEFDITNPRERAAYSRLKKMGKNPLIKKVD